MEILLPTSVKHALAKDFNVSRITVWKALTFKTDSSKANLLRAAALERGGRLFDGTKEEKTSNLKSVGHE